MYNINITLVGEFPDLATALRAAERVCLYPELNATSVQMIQSRVIRTPWAQSVDAVSAPPVVEVASAPAAVLPVKTPRARKEPAAAPLAVTLGKPEGDSMASTLSPPVAPPTHTPAEPDASEGDAAALAPWSEEVIQADLLPAEPTAAAPTVDELRALVGVKISAGYRADISALLRTHGGDSITKVPEANRVAFKRDLEALGATS